MRLSRRELLRMGVGAGAALLLERDAHALPIARLQQQQHMKVIPTSGERIPAMGLGTASSFSAAARTPEEHADLREVVRLFTELGGSVIDTSPSYGQSEVVLGELIREVGNADRIFMATKISGARGRADGVAQLERSLERLRPGDIDLNQVHNLGDWENQLAVLREAKQAGEVRYVGITTSSSRQYEALEQIMRAEQLDFVQLDYAVDNRAVEERLLPLAQDRGMGILVNGPLGRTRLFRRVGDRPLPDYATELGIGSWAQFFLKWLIASPAVTVVIPATSNPVHMRDNMSAGIGPMPDAALRQRMAEFIDSLPDA